MMIVLSMAKGASLPMMSWPGVMGVTMSCSSVPCSFSFTTDTEVRVVVMIMRIMPSTPGTMKLRLARAGLYSTRTAGLTCARRTCRSSAGSTEASRAAVRAADAWFTMMVA